MTDARILTTLPSHPKTKRLIRRLGGDGAWRLVCLILWARDNRPNGDLHGMTDEDIELATDWGGSPGALIDALVQCGFLDGAEGERRVHDWAEHQPWAMGSDDRKLSASWAALCKRHGREGAAKRMPDYAERMRLAEKPDADALRPACDPQETRKRTVSGSDAPSPLPSPLPSPSPSPLPKEPVHDQPQPPAEPLTLTPPDDEPEDPDSTAARSRRSPIELQTWLNSLAADEDPIHADDPIMAYADGAGIEFDWLLLAWDRFRQDMIERRTKKRDWRAHFRNAVRGNWYRLWWARDGGTGLTTVGEQAMMVWRAGK